MREIEKFWFRGKKEKQVMGQGRGERLTWLGKGQQIKPPPCFGDGNIFKGLLDGNVILFFFLLSELKNQGVNRRGNQRLGSNIFRKSSEERTHRLKTYILRK